jgi:hypothetical protein
MRRSKTAAGITPANRKFTANFTAVAPLARVPDAVHHDLRGDAGLTAMREPKQPTVGISGLPKNWATAVQLISTFGLAVFLVLYYLFVIRTEDQKRYENLRASIDALVRINEKGETLLSADLERRLQQIYVEVVSRELADLVVEELKKTPKPADLTQVVRQTMINRTSLVQGLSRKDGVSLSELLANKINNFDLGKKYADYAIATWSGADRNRIAQESHSILMRELDFIAKAK